MITIVMMSHGIMEVISLKIENTPVTPQQRYISVLRSLRPHGTNSQPHKLSSFLCEEFNYLKFLFLEPKKRIAVKYESEKGGQTCF